MKRFVRMVFFPAIIVIGLSACQQSSDTAPKTQAPAAAPAPAPMQAAAKTNEPLYTVVDGDKVDAKTLEGFKAWCAMACERCHGAKQEGMVGPSLIEALKRLTKDEFKNAVMNGRPEKACLTTTPARLSLTTSIIFTLISKGVRTGRSIPGVLSRSQNNFSSRKLSTALRRVRWGSRHKLRLLSAWPRNLCSFATGSGISGGR